MAKSLAAAADALVSAARLPVAHPSLFEFRAFDRLRFYSFINFYLVSPRLTLIYIRLMYSQADLAGFPGLRDVTFAEAILWPQIATARLLKAFSARSPILSTVGVFSQLAYLVTDYIGLIGRSFVLLNRGSMYALARHLLSAIVWRLMWPVLPWWLCDVVGVFCLC